MADMVKEASFLQQTQTNILSDVLMARDDVSQEYVTKFLDGIARMKASLIDTSKAAAAAHAAFEAVRQGCRDPEVPSPRLHVNYRTRSDFCPIFCISGDDLIHGSASAGRLAGGGGRGVNP